MGNTETTWDLTLESGDILNLNGTSYVMKRLTSDGVVVNWRLYPSIQGADDAASDDTSADDTEVDEDSDDTDDDTSGGEDQGEEKKFTQKDLDRILAKEKSKALRGKVDAKELGFESKKELDEFVASMKKKTEDEKTEAEKALEDAVKTAKDEATTEAMSKAKSMTLKAEFKVAAQDAGIPKERLDDAYALAQNLDNWDEDVSIDDDGVVTGLDEDFFKGLEDAKPWLFPTESDDDSGGSGDIGAGAGGKGKAKNKDYDEADYPALKGFTSN